MAGEEAQSKCGAGGASSRLPYSFFAHFASIHAADLLPATIFPSKLPMSFCFGGAGTRYITFFYLPFPVLHTPKA